jgi:hypothetical protein
MEGMATYKVSQMLHINSITRYLPDIAILNNKVTIKWE